MNKVDWTKPIEAVHEDGRVEPTKLDCWYGDGSARVRTVFGCNAFDRENGEHCYGDPVSIRNAANADDTVAVKRVTVMEFHDMFEAMGWQPALESLGYQWAQLTPIEQFLADHPDADRATAELAFARWGGEQ